jgi:hypothetical protein
MAMAGQTIFREIAGLRWGSLYAIEGDGPIACVLACTYRVLLCSDPMTASMAIASSCGLGCNHRRSPYGGWHKQQTLTKPEEYQPSGQFADWDD